MNTSVAPCVLRQSRSLLVAITLVALIVPSSRAAHRYVSPSGDDAHAGTEAEPWRTLAHAFAQLAPGDSLWMRGGTYREPGITLANSGTPGGRILVANFPGETPVVDGAVPAFQVIGNTAWELYDAATETYRSVASSFGSGTWRGSFIADDGEVYRLFTYAALSHLMATTYTYQSGNAYYRGPGFVRHTDGRIYIRIQNLSFPRDAGVPAAATGNIKTVPGTAAGFHPRSYKINLSMTADLVTITGSHLTFDGISFENSDRNVVVTGANDVDFLSCRMFGHRVALRIQGGTHRVSVRWCDTESGHPPYVSWNEVKAHGAPEMKTSIATVDRNSHTLTFEDNRFRKYFDGITIVQSGLHDIYIRNNAFDLMIDDSCQFGSLYNFEVGWNFINGPIGGYNGGAPPAGRENTKWWHHNIIDVRRDEFGRRVGEPGDGTEWRRSHHAIPRHSTAGSDDQVKIYNNTFLIEQNINNRGVSYQKVGGTTGVHEVYNNIIVQDDDREYQRGLGTGSDEKYDYQLFYKSHPGTFQRFNDFPPTATSYATLAEWKSSAAAISNGYDQNSREANPQFSSGANPDVRDYRPSASGPAAVGAKDLSATGWPGSTAASWVGAVDPNASTGLGAVGPRPRGAGDVIPPAVSITAPAGGAVVAGTIFVTASASDNVGVAGVQFKLDGLPLGAEITAAPYTILWDTAAVTDGSHILTAVARDAAGNTTTSTALNVIVNNSGSDLTPPTVAFTSPVNATTVSGMITLAAAASDDVGVVGVQFKVDGVNLGAEDMIAPYSIDWDTTTVGDGARTLTAVARDAAGNTASSTISVTVKNSSGTAGAWYGVTFDDPAVLADWQVHNGTWSLGGGVLTGDGKPASIFLSLQPTQVDYEIEANVRLSSSGFLGIFGRAVSREDQQSVLLNISANNNVARLVVLGNVREVPFTLLENRWYNLRLVMRGAEAHAYIDDVLVLSREDAHVIAGEVGLRMHTGTMQYRDFTVRLFDNEPPVIRNLTASPANLWPVTHKMVPVTITADVVDALDPAPTARIVAVSSSEPPNGLGDGHTALDWEITGNLTLNLRAERSGLAGGRTYMITVEARDTAGNTSRAAVPVIVAPNASPDRTAPFVSMTAPVPGALVSGTIPVQADATDNIGVAGVQFTLDGASLGTEDPAPPYATIWNTATTADGLHTVAAVARDAAGNTASASVKVTVDNTPPVVSLTSPDTGAILTGTVPIEASASDNLGLAGVELQLDGIPLAPEIAAGPYTLNWDTTMASDGAHVLSAVARDSAGHLTTSAGVNVTVDNTPPTVSIISPLAGATVSGIVPVVANATDLVGVAGVQFKLDGTDLGTEASTPPYSVNWDTTSAPDGVHLLSAVARDTAGHVSTSLPVNVTVDSSGTGGGGIAFRGASSATTGTVTATSVAVDRPAGVVTGDFMLAGVAVSNDDAIITAPAGWTLVRTITDTMRLSIYRRTADASEPASYTWSSSISRRIAVGIVAFSGVNPVAPIQIENGAGEPVTQAAHTTPTITTTGASTWLVSIFGDRRNGGSTWTPPEGATERVDVRATSGTNDPSLAINTQGPAAAGDHSHTATANGASGAACMAILALQP
jgi:hypothetical protein